jgi:hypothetical protein
MPTTRTSGAMRANTAHRYPLPDPTSSTRAPGTIRSFSSSVTAACMWGAESVAPCPMGTG